MRSHNLPPCSMGFVDCLPKIPHPAPLSSPRHQDKQALSAALSTALAELCYTGFRKLPLLRREVQTCSEFWPTRL
jgi:hypothetical protein